MSKSYLTTDPRSWFNKKELARNNRKDQTLAEEIVWNSIRKNQIGIKFRRQQVIGEFIVDFVSLDKKLIIEIDGESHILKKEYDEWRTSQLNVAGFKVIRFSNQEVYEKMDKVLEEIRNILNLL